MSCLGSFFFWSCSSMNEVVFSWYLKIICDYNQSDAKHRLIGGISWFYGCISTTLWNKPLEFDLEIKLLTRFQEVNGLSWILIMIQLWYRFFSLHIQIFTKNKWRRNAMQICEISNLTYALEKSIQMHQLLLNYAK